MKELNNLKRVAMEELEKLDAKYANQSEFTAADAEMYKCLAMALEKHMRIEQIEGEMNEMPGMSGRRGRSPMTGRYVSKEAPYYRPPMPSGYYPEPLYDDGRGW